MAAKPESFRIAAVDSSAAANAFDFHRAITASDPHVWPRSEAQIKAYADDQCLFGAWRDSSGELVGIVYVVPIDDQWEVGGLSVDPSCQGKGIGSALVKFALAHTMAWSQPWKSKRRPKQQVVAHIHKENAAPRKIFSGLGFIHSKTVTIPGDKAPPSMKRDQSGNVCGDELRFTRDGLINLSRWFNEEFKGVLSRGDELEFDLGKDTLDNLRAALRGSEGDSPD
jgi:ribosomal protein S18 acetylase RimI-like enzyme